MRCRIMIVGPITHRSGPLAQGESKVQAKESHGNNIKPKKVQRCCRGQFSPRQTQNSPKKRGKNGIRINLKENLKGPRKAALTIFSLQDSAPIRAGFLDFINRPQQLWIGTDGTSISLEKVDPTRGRRKANVGRYKRESKSK